MRGKGLVLIILVIIIIIAGLLSYHYYFNYHKKKLISDFIQQNLREEFWPSEIQLKTGENKSFLASWSIAQTSLTALIKPDGEKIKCALGISIPEQKFLNSASAREIFRSYFAFSLEDFNCVVPTAYAKEDISACYGSTDNKTIDILSYKRLDSEEEGTYISISEICEAKA